MIRTQNTNIFRREKGTDLDFIEMPNNQNNKVKSDANIKKTELRSNFFQNYDKDSIFLVSNQENSSKILINMGKNIEEEGEEKLESSSELLGLSCSECDSLFDKKVIKKYSKKSSMEFKKSSTGLFSRKELTDESCFSYSSNNSSQYGMKRGTSNIKTGQSKFKMERDIEHANKSKLLMISIIIIFSFIVVLLFHLNDGLQFHHSHDKC